MMNRVAYGYGATDRPDLAIPTTGAYTTGQAIGGVVPLPNPLVGLLGDITLLVMVSTAIEMDILLFDGNPGTNFATDKVAVTGSLRASGAQATVNIPSTAWKTYGAENIATVSNLSLFLDLIGSICIVARGSITLSANQMLVKLGMAKDR